MKPFILATLLGATCSVVLASGSAAVKLELGSGTASSCSTQYTANFNLSLDSTDAQIDSTVTNNIKSQLSGAVETLAKNKSSCGKVTINVAGKSGAPPAATFDLVPDGSGSFNVQNMQEINMGN